MKQFSLSDYVPFEAVSDDDLAKAKLFNKCRLAESGCWIWVGAHDRVGYGAVKFKGRNYGAHIRSYQLFKGDIPKGLHVMHACDTPACCNPMHLSLGTRSENMQDSIAKGRFRKSHGALNNLAKLTDADVSDIRNSTQSIKAICRKYGIDRSNAYYILNGTTWKHVPMPAVSPKRTDERKKLTKDQVLAIKSADASISQRQLASKFGVGEPTISMIRNGRVWKSVTVSQETVNGN